MLKFVFRGVLVTLFSVVIIGSAPVAKKRNTSAVKEIANLEVT